MTTELDSLTKELSDLLEELSVDDLLLLLPDEKSRKIGLILNTKGFQSAMKFATEKLGKLDT